MVSYGLRLSSKTSISEGACTILFWPGPSLAKHILFKLLQICIRLQLNTVSLERAGLPIHIICHGLS